jgi:large subunit ribosomal protein L13
MNRTTFSPKPQDITRSWHQLDASGRTLGRLATEIAGLLMGKKKVYYSAHIDCGDYVVVTNAKDITVTGTKLKTKVYYRHSGFPGGLKSVTLGKQLDNDPTKIIEWAVKGMLPKNKLQDPRLRRLKVFAADVHPYASKFKSKSEK